MPPMHVERLDIEGFRNCCESVTFDPSLTLLLGENNAGKSNLPPHSPYVTAAGTSVDVPVNMDAGTYNFQCDPHASSMNGGFTVG